MATRRIDVISASNLHGSRVRLVEVTLRHGDQRFDVVLDNEHPRMAVEFEAVDGSRQVEYQYRALVAASEETDIQFESPVATTETAVLIINPGELYQVLALQAVGMFDFEQYSAAFVDFRITAGDAGVVRTATLSLTPDRRETGERVVIDRKLDAQIDVRLRYVSRTGELLEQDWRKSDGALVVVANPAREYAPA